MKIQEHKLKKKISLNTFLLSLQRTKYGLHSLPLYFMQQLQAETHLLQFGPLTRKSLCLFSVPLKRSPTCSFKHDHKWAKPLSPSCCLVLFTQTKVALVVRGVFILRGSMNPIGAQVRGAVWHRRVPGRPLSKALAPPVPPRDRVLFQTWSRSSESETSPFF